METKGQTRKKHKNQLQKAIGSHRKTKKQRKSPCVIPTQVPVLNYSSPHRSDNFYEWVNEEWLKKASIPPFESDYSVSEEIERCIFQKSVTLLRKIQYGQHMNKQDDIVFCNLIKSCLHSRVQQQSVLFLKQQIHSLICLNTIEDIVRISARIHRIGLKSILQMTSTIDENGLSQILIDSDSSSLHMYLYDDDKKISKYKELLREVGPALDCPELEKVFPIEKQLANKVNILWSDNKTKTTGHGLVRKFPSIPWGTWFEEFGIQNWKDHIFYYQSPRYFRFLGRLLKEMVIDGWKLYLARCLIIPSLRYLPPPFDEVHFDFFGRELMGTTQKLPQIELCVQIIHGLLSNEFSKRYWDEYGSKEILEEAPPFAQSIVDAAKERIKETEWLEEKTRKAAIEKIESIKIEIVKPKKWIQFEPVKLDPKNLLHNLFLLGERKTKIDLDHIDKRYIFWEQGIGIYNVNAYYYNENNEILIPYASMMSPFYKSGKKNVIENYGALGSVIGHEICHGFDEDGKEYDEKGRKRRWWTRKDNRAYFEKAKKLIQLFSKQKMYNKKVNGERTLSENIADLAGLGISLYALQKYLDKNGVIEGSEERKKAYRRFFISFANSWRTKYRKEKLLRSLYIDRHAPAELRVNLIVNQFDEWYEAFDIDNTSKLYRKPEDRIRIF